MKRGNRHSTVLALIYYICAFSRVEAVKSEKLGIFKTLFFFKHCNTCKCITKSNNCSSVELLTLKKILRHRTLVTSPRGQGVPVGCGPGCGWLNIDTVEEEVVVGFRRLLLLKKKKVKKNTLASHSPACVTLQLLFEQVKLSQRQRVGCSVNSVFFFFF